MAASKELLRPCNVWPDMGLNWFDGMFFCLDCGNSFMFLSQDGEMSWHDNPFSDPDRPVAERHTNFVGLRVNEAGERVPL